MPSTSAKQHRFMEAIAHNSAFAKKAGVPQSVGKDFSAADKGRTFSKGGATMMKKSGKEAMMAMAARSAMRRPPMAPMPSQAPTPMASQAPTPMASQAGMPGMKKGGGVESRGKTVGAVIKMAKGGSVSSRADGIASRGKTNCKIC